MKLKRLFELRDRLRRIAFLHKNLSQIVMRLSELWVEPRRLQIMRLCFLQLALCEKRARKIDMGIDKTRVRLQSLPILGDCLFQPLMFFQERAIAIPGLGGLWRQTHSGFGLRRRFLNPTELLQEINMTGVVLVVVRVDPERLLEMSLRFLQVSFSHQDSGQTDVGLSGIGIKTECGGKVLG